MSELSPLESIFFTALGMMPTERAAYLAEACAGDDSLRRRVEKMLAAQTEAHSFLEAPPAAIAAQADATIDQPVTEKIGTQIGPYKLLQQIGEGGFGVVFMAEQTEPVRRKVALKLIKPGMDTRQVIARFEAERQALAVMDHPNIAKVLDAGTFGEGRDVSPPVDRRADAAPLAGRPFFVMELVRGIPITQYCDENSLQIRERLELFAAVCQAIQHAHTKGIIHRDVKPTNVLVTRQDGQPVVKVIDFGIAKAMGQQLTDKTLFTDFAQIIGTPLYMSPEQAELSSTDIDTRSDIYSLGVLLYELLTGTTPVSKEQLKKAAFDEIRRIIREDEPPKPSTRISTAEAAPSIAAQRHTEPAKLAKLVRGELDWIVMKALEKDRNRRYETASGFARDVQRYLNDEQVQACPPSAMYRFRKFARRNKGPVLAVSLVALALIGGVIGTTWGMFRATHAEAEAKREAGEKSVALGQKVTALKTARANEIEAEKQTTLAKKNAKAAKEQEQLARRRFYAAQMNLALQAWEAGQPARALELLETLRPKIDEDDPRGFEWYYLWQLCHRNLHRIVSGPTGEAVFTLAVTPDGKTLVSGSQDGSVRVWDIDTGKERAVLTGHKSDVNRLAISRDGKLIASSSFDGTAKLWDLSTCELLATLKASGALRSVAFSPDGKVLAAGTESGGIELWDVETRNRRLILPAHPGPTLALAYSPDGQMLASGCAWGDKPGPASVKVWDVTSDPFHIVFEAAESECAAFSPDSKLLATCHYGNRFSGVKVWSVPAGELTATFDSPGSSVKSAAFSADASTLVLGCHDRTVKLWEFATGATRTVGVHLGSVPTVAFVPQSDLLASASNDGSVKLWHVGPPTDTAGFTQDGNIRTIGFAPDSKLLLVGSDRTTAVLDATSGEQKTTVPVSGVHAVSADANFLAARVSGDKWVIWDVAAAREKARLPTAAKGSAAAFSRDGKMLVTWKWDAPDAVKLWDLATSRVRLRFDKNIHGAAFSPDGTTLALAQQFGVVTLWDAATGRQRMTLQQFEVGTGHAYAVAFSNDGKMLAAGNDEGMLRLWNVETGQLKASFKGHTEAIQSLAFSPNDRTLLSGSADKTARLWDVVTGQELLTLKGHISAVTLVAFAPDGKRLATAGGAIVKLWLAATVPQATALRSELDPDDPDGPRASITGGDRLLDTHQPQEAEKAYHKALTRLEKLVATLPDSPEYREELAYGLLAANLINNSTAAAAQSRARFDEIWRTLSPDRRFRLGMRLLARGNALRTAERFPEAVSVFEQLTELMPSYVVGWHQMAYTLDLSGQPEQAIAAYSKAIDVDPKNAASWNNRGVLYIKLRQFEKAIADYRQAVALEPNNSILVTNLGADLRRQGKLDDAIAILRQGLAAIGSDDPNALKIKIQLAEVYRSQENLPEEIGLLEQIRDQHQKTLGESDATTLTSMNELAAAYWRNKQLDRSIPLLEETVRLNRADRPADDPETYTSIANLGVNYRDAGWPDEALPLLKEVVEWAKKQPPLVSKQFAWVVSALAEMYEQNQQLDKAEALLREALERTRQQFPAGDPRSAGPLASLCRNLLLQQQYDVAEPLVRECLALREKAEPDAWTTFNTQSMLGGCLLGQKKYAEAEPLLTQGYAGMKARQAKMLPTARPRLTEAIERLIRLYEDWNQPQQAAQWRKKLEEDRAPASGDVKQVARIHPKTTTLQFQLGDALMKQGKLDEAAVAFRQAIDVCPSDATILRSLTLNLVNLKAQDYSRSRLQKAAERNPSASTAYLILGGVLLDHKKRDKAIACYQRAIELEPDHVDGYQEVGITLLENSVDPREVDAAAGFLEKGLEIDPKHVQCRWSLGRARQRQKRFDDAVACFRTCLELDPKHFGSHWGLGFALLDQKKPDEALPWFRKAVALNPNHGYAQYGLGRALTELKEYPEAIAALREAVRLEPSRQDAHAHLGWIYFELKQFSDGETEFREAIRLKPDQASSHFGLGRVLQEQKKPLDAIACFREALRLKPDDVSAHDALGWALIQQKQPAEAEAEFREGVRLDPQRGGRHFGLGRALFDQEKFAEAETALREVIRLEPANSSAQQLLVQALIKQGKQSEADELLKRKPQQPAEEPTKAEKQNRL